MEAKEFILKEKELIKGLCEKYEVKEDVLDKDIYRRLLRTLKDNGGNLGYKDLNINNLIFLFEGEYSYNDFVNTLLSVEIDFKYLLNDFNLPVIDSDYRLDKRDYDIVKKGLECLLEVPFFKEYIYGIADLFNDGTRFVEWNRYDTYNVMDFVIKTGIKEIQRYGVNKARTDSIIAATKELDEVYGLRDKDINATLSVNFCDDITPDM